MNVSDSDGTLILTWGWPTGGTETTLKLAKKFKKPYLMVDLSKNHDPLFVIEWAKTNKIKVLNVAGPRESKTAGIHDMAIEFFRKYLNCEFLEMVRVIDKKTKKRKRSD
jgi:hypothetical protein